MSRTPVAVAVINTSADVVRMLRTALEEAGFVVVAILLEDVRTGRLDLPAFLREHDPRVIVYDVAPPYEPNWRFLDHLKRAPGFEGRHFVLTSSNVERLHEIVGTDDAVYEIVGLRQDLNAIVRAVKEASRARPTR